jgi:tRNA nucleotidyltransferase (CCA-adding enzyme)
MFDRSSRKALAMFINRHLYNNKKYKLIINKLWEHNFEVYITGGFIRDLIFEGNVSDDIDFVTNAVPEELEKIFKDYNVSSEGKSFLVTLVNGVEIATYRKDVINNGVRTDCLVEKEETLEGDLSRRDLTINAIAFSPVTDKFIDPTGGWGDLEDRTIRFIGDPQKRILEDYERILRACRFLTKIDGFLDTSTLIALRRNVDCISLIAPERIRLEIRKTMNIQKASPFFRSMYHIGALKYIFPSLEGCYDHDGGPYHNETIFQHCMDTGDTIYPKYWRTKLAGYLHDVGKPPTAELDNKTYLLKFICHESEGAKLVKRELKRLTFSNDDTNFISNSVAVHMRSFNKTLTKKALRRFMVSLTHHGITYRDWFRLFIADKHANRKSRDFTFGEIKSFIQKIKSLYVEEHVFSTRDLKINGFDVMKHLHINSGPEVGKILKELFEHCIETPEDNNRETLIDLLTSRS